MVLDPLAAGVLHPGLGRSLPMFVFGHGRDLMRGHLSRLPPQGCVGRTRRCGLRRDPVPPRLFCNRRGFLGCLFCSPLVHIVQVCNQTLEFAVEMLVLIVVVLVCHGFLPRAAAHLEHHDRAAASQKRAVWHTAHRASPLRHGSGTAPALRRSCGKSVTYRRRLAFHNSRNSVGGGAKFGADGGRSVPDAHPTMGQDVALLMTALIAGAVADGASCPIWGN